MSATAAILVFISVFMHAAWNLMSKTTQPSTAFYIIMNFVGGIIWLPFFWISADSFWGLPPAFYWLFGATCVFEVLYMYGLAHGYKHGDISLIYPLVRTLPVLMLAVITLVAGIGKPFGAFTMFGMIVIACGCLIMPFQSFRNISFKNLNGIALIFVFLGAIGTTGYTLCDSEALKLVAPDGKVSEVCTLGYLFLMQAGLTLGEVPLVIFDKKEHAAMKNLWGKKIIYPILAGVISSMAYALILLAMQHVTNVSYIQAFRQLSLPIGFVAGVIFLGEKSTATKIVGLTLILTGLVIVSLTK